MCKKHADTKRPSGGRDRGGRLSRSVALFIGGVLLSAALIAGGSGSGLAAIPQEDPFAGVEVLGAAEMAEKRGGFVDAALGISLNLGANIRTSINGSVILETLVQFTGAGAPTVNHTVAPAAADIVGLTFLSADGSAVVGDIDVLNTMGNAVTLTALNGVAVTVPAGFEGLVAQTDTGVIAAVHMVTDEQFANLVVNTNPGTVTETSALTDSGFISVDVGSDVLQTLNINIDVEGFSALQRNVRLNASMEKFRAAMRSASLSALGTN